MNDEIKVPTMQVTSLKKICMTIGELPTSYLETMSYYEMLVWFTNYLRDNIIPVVNNNGEATHELQVLFTELQSYVNNYFDNLDVQDEINNKLDQMLEDGVLEQIIEQFLQLTSLICFDNVAGMKASVNLANGSYAKTLGYYAINDGGGALYKVRAITNEDDVDEMIIIALTDNTLIAELVTDDLNIKQLGANGVVANDTKALKRFATSNIKSLKIPNGTYLLNDIIDLEDKELIGLGNPTININGITTAREHTIHVDGSCHIKGINFELNIRGTNILGFYNSHDCIIENCKFKVNDVACNGYVDIYTNNQNIRFIDCDFKCYSTNNGTPVAGGLWVREMTDNHTTKNITFDNCNFNHKSADEVIACWNDNSLLEEVKINNSFFLLQPESLTPNMVRFDCLHSSINNCTFIYKVSDSTNRSCLIVNNDHNDVFINDCVFDTSLTFSNGIGNGSKITFNNCYFKNNKNTKISKDSTFRNCKFDLLSMQNRGSAYLYNCIFNITENTGWMFGKNVTLNNCEFNITTNSAPDFIQLFEDDIKIKIYNTNVNIGTDTGTMRIGNMTSHTGILEVNNSMFTRLNLANTSNFTGYVTNSLSKEAITTVSTIKYNNNFNINSQ